VVADPLADNTPGRPARLDWDATLAFRHHLWRHGLGVADAMDTAQRGMGLDWAATAELIRRSAAEAASVGGALVCGAGTDQLPPGEHDLAAVLHAYEEQLEVLEDAGAGVVLMASRALAANAAGPADYAKIYGSLLAQVRRPVLLHWLGPMFDPALAGYWGSADLDLATDAFLQIIAAHPDKVDGVKVSLLDADREVALRRRLPEGVRCYTGDDFHYPELILGDGRGHSDALLGVFDPIAAAASAALAALDAGDEDGYRRIFAPTVPLARLVFAEPTFHYKTGIVFLAWLAGHQTHFTMVSGMQSARSLPHLGELFVLADQAGLLPDPDLAAARMRALLTVAGL
ncbi:MAG TPA: dihydrodipicolinate synthase family protein, partial [Pseudonocardia sp.]|nr:dihydrodipicolinate synthase family protein [Pseudonocardia sp.]